LESIKPIRADDCLNVFSEYLFELASRDELECADRPVRWKARPIRLYHSRKESSLLPFLAEHPLKGFLLLDSGGAVGLWFAIILCACDFNGIQRCRPQAKCDSTLGWSTPFGYS